MRWLGPLLALLLPLPAAALEMRPGAERTLSETEPLGTHVLATGPFADGALPSRAAEGAVLREAWRVPGDRTTLELLAPLRDQVVAEGWEVLLDCEAQACGGFDFRDAVEVLPPPAMFADLSDFRYLAAERGTEALSLLVSRSDREGFVQVIRVAPPDPAPGGPTPGTAAEPAPEAGGSGRDAPAPEGDLGARIEAEGRVVLEGLSFGTGSAELAPGGDAALAALARYLAANPSRRVALVGHTDAEGPLDANVALSRRRAEAVVERLVEAHGADGSRLSAEGMGWLAPRATNLTPEGREANRRVEAVVLP